MLHTGLKKWLWCYGPDTELCYVRFTPSGSTGAQTLTEAQGVTGVNCTAAGAYTITFAKKPQCIIPIAAREIENDTTHYHVVRVESTNASAGTAAVTHKSVAFASVASGPSLSDTVDGLCFAFLLRVAT